MSKLCVLTKTFSSFFLTLISAHIRPIQALFRTKLVRIKPNWKMKTDVRAAVSLDACVAASTAAWRIHAYLTRVWWPNQLWMFLKLPLNCIQHKVDVYLSTLESEFISQMPHLFQYYCCHYLQMRFRNLTWHHCGRRLYHLLH